VSAGRGAPTVLDLIDQGAVDLWTTVFLTLVVIHLWLIEISLLSLQSGISSDCRWRRYPPDMVAMIK
jgi:hypothetical protein